ncbi:PspC domain-containing protein [Saccharopolyspora sp. NFXS83]|uniref:PspC domain-containing protein n=1 Tax=Saccharopolyspora sp. NFXS83 TaxID=2993560 RepID=UPI002B059F4D|nr:PspC domain-containing protein [Saccharopolyspora sp. NFXS83]
MTETTNHRFDETTAHVDAPSASTSTGTADHVLGTGAESPGHDQATGPTTGAAAEPAYRRFRRRRDGLIAGVCGGVGDLLGVDATLVRVGLVAATILGFGSGILLYLACWVLVPQD